MIRMKTVEVPAKSSEVVDFVKCDLCGATGDDETDWATKPYEVKDVEIRMKTGVSYPEGGDCEEIQYHVCPKCFKDKLMPWFREQGAIETKTDLAY